MAKVAGGVQLFPMTARSIVLACNLKASTPSPLKHVAGVTLFRRVERAGCRPRLPVARQFSAKDAHEAAYKCNFRVICAAVVSSKSGVALRKSD
jgi:hypothetical protein